MKTRKSILGWTFFLNGNIVAAAKSLLMDRTITCLRLGVRKREHWHLHASGKKDHRPPPAACLKGKRAGDTLKQAYSVLPC